MHLKPEISFYGLNTDIEDYYVLGYMCNFSNKFSLVFSKFRKTQLNIETILFVLLFLFYKLLYKKCLTKSITKKYLSQKPVGLT